MKDEELQKTIDRLKERWKTQVFRHGNYTVEVLNAGGIRYTDPSKSVWAWGEVLTGDIAYVVKSRSMHYWGDETALVDDVVRKEVGLKIKDVFHAHGLQVDVE